ncbi:MAG: hypothetical protein HC769_30310 [Cyanobacteria bacterium CRU_2_1]|nr:hypothetical protein [Cyanobacteria bacterium CRU_2_1]
MSEVEGAIDGGIQLTTRLERTGRGDRRGSIGYWQPLNRTVRPLEVVC